MRKRLLVKANGIANARKSGVFSGVGRSTHKLLSALNDIDELPFDIAIYVDGISSIGFDFYGWKFPHSIFPVPVSWGNKKTSFEPWFRKHFMKYDLLHIPHNDDWVYDGEKFVVTIHDVSDYDLAVENNNQSVIEKWQRMANKSVGIMTCSNFSKSMIIDRLHVPDDKITVVYWGTSTDVFYINKKTETEKRLREMGVSGSYFLSVSCTHRRKNIRTLLRAYRQFREKWSQIERMPCRHKLLLVWNNAPKDLLREYSKEIDYGNIIFMNSISDDDLRSLYCGATCTMFPSLAEGFGFPILESFACGTPIMTCKNTSLTEVGKDVAIYVGENNVDEMVRVMMCFEKGEYDMEKFIVNSKRIVDTFSWHNTAREYIKFYQKFL